MFIPGWDMGDKARDDCATVVEKDGQLKLRLQMKASWYKSRVSLLCVTQTHFDLRFKRTVRLADLMIPENANVNESRISCCCCLL